MANPARPRFQVTDDDLARAADAPGPDRPFPTGRGVLSAAEIEALLRPDLPEPETPAAPGHITPVPTPDLSVGADDDLLRQAGELAARCSYVMRAQSDMDVRFSASACRETGLPDMRFPKGSAVCFFAGPDGTIDAALALAPNVIRALAHTACGATSTEMDMSALTPLETAVAFRMLEPLAGVLGEDIRLVRIETREADARALLPPCLSLEAELSAHMCGQTGPAVFANRQANEQISPQHAPEAGMAKGQLTTLVTARIASLSVPVSRLADLKPGATLLLGVPTDQPVELLTGGHRGTPIGEGQVGRKGNKIAVKLNRKVPGL